MKYSELIEAIINEQANDAKKLTIAVLEGKIDAEVTAYHNIVAEGIFGVERNPIEVTEANFEELLNSLTEEQLAEMEAELAAKEAEGLSEEELSEISKERLTAYKNKTSYTDYGKIGGDLKKFVSYRTDKDGKKDRSAGHALAKTKLKNAKD